MNYIPMNPVTSGNIEAIGYDAGTKTMAVQFKGGRPAYHYSDVPEEAHVALIGAESIGKHFAAHIKGKFSHVQLEPEAPGTGLK